MCIKNLGRLAKPSCPPFCGSAAHFQPWPLLCQLWKAVPRETGVVDEPALGNIILSSSGAAKAEVTSVSCRQGQAYWHDVERSYHCCLRGRPHCRDRERDHLEETCAEMKCRFEGDTKGFLGYADKALVPPTSGPTPSPSPLLPRMTACWTPPS